MSIKRDVKLNEGSKKARKRAARLAAVQILYQAEHQAQDILSVLAEYNKHRLGFDMDGDLFVPADTEILAKIINGYQDRKEDIKEIVTIALNGKNPRQIELLLLNIIELGAYELLSHHDIDAGIIIADYMSVTEAFFDNSEKKLVNAVLDNIKKSVR